jgi:cytochrome c oxidase cbb3-type subunit 3
MKVILILAVAPILFAAPNEQDLAEGKALFRSNCAFCHGLTGQGGRGPALAGRELLHGSTTADIKAVIRNGVPGSNMPAYDHMDNDELDRLVAFVQQFATGSGNVKHIAGDITRGRQVYQRSGCAGCHRIGAEGSIYGPDLSRVGAARSADYLRDSLLKPSADIPDEFQGVTVVTRDGKRITGVRVNEDTFSVQLRDPGQNFKMFQKSAVKEVIAETKSLMPAYTSLSPDDLQNLLAYLDSLRGDTKAGAGVKKSEGIR